LVCADQFAKRGIVCSSVLEAALAIIDQDRDPASEVLGEHPEGNRCEIRSSKYLNNLIEQDHRSIKLRLGPMLGFKRFRRAATTIVGIELMHRIRKGQFKLGKLRVKNKTAPETWNAVLGA
jgi:transposase-like protein